MSELVSLLERMVEKKIDTKIQNFACVLGRITARGVKLDNLNYEIEKPYFLEWNVKLTLKQGKMKGQIGAGLTAGPYLVQGVLNFPTELEIAVDDVKVETKTKYKVGDRVLCIMLNEGREVVVVGRIVK